MSRSSSGSEASLQNSQEADLLLSQISLVQSTWGPWHRQGVVPLGLGEGGFPAPWEDRPLQHGCGRRGFNMDLGGRTRLQQSVWTSASGLFFRSFSPPRTPSIPRLGLAFVLPSPTSPIQTVDTSGRLCPLPILLRPLSRPSRRPLSSGLLQ